MNENGLSWFKRFMIRRGLILVIHFFFFFKFENWRKTLNAEIWLCVCVMWCDLIDFTIFHLSIGKRAECTCVCIMQIGAKKKRFENRRRKKHQRTGTRSSSIRWHIKLIDLLCVNLCCILLEFTLNYITISIQFSLCLMDPLHDLGDDLFSSSLNPSTLFSRISQSHPLPH